MNIMTALSRHTKKGMAWLLLAAMFMSYAPASAFADNGVIYVESDDSSAAGGSLPGTQNSEGLYVGQDGNVAPDFIQQLMNGAAENENIQSNDPVYVPEAPHSRAAICTSDRTAPLRPTLYSNLSTAV